MKVANIGLGHLSIKNKKVLLVALNTSVIAKFSEVCSTSEYELETVGSVDLCEEELKTQGSSIYAVVLPPAASTTQQNTLKLLAGKKLIITVTLFDNYDFKIAFLNFRNVSCEIHDCCASKYS